MNAIDQRLRNMRLGVVKFEAGIVSYTTEHMIRGRWSRIRCAPPRSFRRHRNVRIEFCDWHFIDSRKAIIAGKCRCEDNLAAHRATSRCARACYRSAGRALNVVETRVVSPHLLSKTRTYSVRTAVGDVDFQHCS